VILLFRSTIQSLVFFISTRIILGPGILKTEMQHAKGDYFIIFDSDCIIPANYLSEVEQSLERHYVDCFGPDKALDSLQTFKKDQLCNDVFFLTTGGGGSEKIDVSTKSFNIGISRKAFEASKGFGNIHPGDPDLSIRLWNLGFETKLIPTAYVYHKRRIGLGQVLSCRLINLVSETILTASWYPQ
jgi:GT2 family glycosyltransferase